MDETYEWSDNGKVNGGEAHHERISNTRTSLIGGAYIEINIGHLFKGLLLEWTSGISAPQQYESGHNNPRVRGY